MTLKALKSELSELQAEKKQLVDKSVISNNGLMYRDHRSLFLCDEFSTIISLTLKRCRACNSGREVLELTEEEREMYLDDKGNVNEVNRGTDEPVTACLILASIKDGKENVKRIVYRRNEGAKRCPKEL